MPGKGRDPNGGEGRGKVHGVSTILPRIGILKTSRPDRNRTGHWQGTSLPLPNTQGEHRPWKCEPLQVPGLSDPRVPTRTPRLQMSVTP